MPHFNPHGVPKLYRVARFTSGLGPRAELKLSSPEQCDGDGSQGWLMVGGWFLKPCDPKVATPNHRILTTYSNNRPPFCGSCSFGETPTSPMDAKTNQYQPLQAAPQRRSRGSFPAENGRATRNARCGWRFHGLEATHAWLSHDWLVKSWSPGTPWRRSRDQPTVDP